MPASPKQALDDAAQALRSLSLGHVEQRAAAEQKLAHALTLVAEALAALARTYHS